MLLVAPIVSNSKVNKRLTMQLYLLVRWSWLWRFSSRGTSSLQIFFLVVFACYYRQAGFAGLALVTPLPGGIGTLPANGFNYVSGGNVCPSISGLGGCLAFLLF